MKKKIYIISQTENHLTQRGKRHTELAEVLSKKHDVTYYSSNFYHGEKEFLTREQEKEANKVLDYKLNLVRTIRYNNNISIHRVISNLIFGLKVFLSLAFKEKPKNAIIIVPSRPVELLFFISFFHKNNTLVMDVRDIWPDAFEHLSNKALLKAFTFYCNLWLKPSVKKFDKFIKTIPTFQEWIDRYAADKESKFIPLGFSETRFGSTFQYEHLLKEQEKDAPISIVYLGMLQKVIDVMPFVKAINNNPKYSLDLYGDPGIGEMYGKVKAYLEETKSTNIKIKGMLAQDEVGGVISKYDIGLQPMRARHSLPNKTFDYIANLLPIMSIGNHDTSKLVIEEGIGWATVFDENKIQEILDTIDHEVIKKKQEQMRVIRNKYSRSFFFDEVENIIRA
ncbi:glycosyltransferase family 4 protein [Flammeovirga agarivorans]|uniref:Glycosyltransferase family 4 protein n=1 Tax=Flammeovirga agarivorans TaxID=2726742 RepID=A0A7X8XY69_9BACT|nr:glycosyltransferase family 4 protein [Flammeovirga agarivorans]NLR93932.1 glycosyltransferase family 4 protein [Flammeovirga agarivorans]